MEIKTVWIVWGGSSSSKLWGTFTEKEEADKLARDLRGDRVPVSVYEATLTWQ